ncbi:MAG: aminotransferase class I/II-fold pyridoxal phosphate-dependent enzyme [Bacteroidota bacterium]
MSQPKIWLSSPHMSGREQEYVNDAFATNWIAPLGPHVNAFEEVLAKYTGVTHAAALSSGTAALHLAIILLEIGEEDAVLCQSKTFSASANPIRYQGATPVFIDSEPDTFNMDPQALEEAIKACRAQGKQPKAIMPVHLYGMPAKMKEICALAAQYEIPIIEDAAEALGATYHGQSCGSFGQLAALSFNGNKIITTSGGGALIGNEEALIAKSRFLATQARDPAPHYQHSHIGYNYRLSNVLAGIGLGQMEVLDERVRQRRANFERYLQYFQRQNNKGYNIRFQQEQEGMFSNRWLSCITVDPAENNGLTREKIRLTLADQNIEARPLWKPMHLQPVFKDYPYFGGKTAEHLFDIGLCLPSGSNLTEDDFARIFTCLDTLFE